MDNRKGHDKVSGKKKAESETLNQRCARLENELESLAAERDLLLAVLDLMPDSIFAKDKNKKFIISNKKHFTSLGCKSVEDILGKSDTDFFPEALAKEFEEGDEEIIRSGKALVVREEHGIEPTTGEENYILVSKALLGEEFGGGLAGIARNITQLKYAIFAAEEAKELAERANKAKNNFLAKMSHEVRTPLNGIMGISRLLMYSDTDPNNKAQLKVVYDSAEALLAIVSDMLDLTNIEAGNATLRKKTFSLAAVISESLNIIFVSNEDNSLIISNAISEEAPEYLVGDSVKLRQILINLLSNAKKFTIKGNISLEVSVLEQGENKIHLLFSIDDEGMGIAKKDRKIIFESFKQADNSLSRKYGGAGLGLSISSELVRLMGGKLKVVSPSPKFGIGSQFNFDVIFELDREKRTNNNTGSIGMEFYIEQLRKVAESGKILLVEDNPVNQQIALAILSKAGLQVDLAEDGQQAIEAVDRNNYKLVLMDLQMPVMDGLTATRLIRKRYSKDLPIIALTAQVLEGDRESCMNAGMNAYIPKPIKPETLYSTLLKYFLL